MNTHWKTLKQMYSERVHHAYMNYNQLKGHVCWNAEHASPAARPNRGALEKHDRSSRCPLCKRISSLHCRDSNENDRPAEWQGERLSASQI
ncbi:hypothetical protein CDAR_466491 [Caerostris darwini]|uniref:Uncharacterized protein n=1 Tax=Caerostris darwini TaxID=1538125 RepID=A0AAV4WAT8_9ARAC|nr:hypothetical protein CDAR_466491 [Caerostris darwini]